MNFDGKAILRATRSVTKFLSVSSVSLGLLAGTVGSTRAGILVNGDFESPTLSPNSYVCVEPTGWRFAGTDNESVIFNGSSVGFPLPASGHQYEDVGPGSSFSMAQTFTIASSGDYGLSWLDNAHQQYGPLTSYVVQIVSSPDHSLVWSETLTPTLDMWASRSAQMALVNGQYTISFTPTDLGWQADRLIDNVVLVAVPEPSTFAMSAVLVLPFGMLVVRHLRQRAKTA